MSLASFFGIDNSDYGVKHIVTDPKPNRKTGVKPPSRHLWAIVDATGTTRLMPPLRGRNYGWGSREDALADARAVVEGLGANFADLDVVCTLVPTGGTCGPLRSVSHATLPMTAHGGRAAGWVRGSASSLLRAKALLRSVRSASKVGFEPTPFTPLISWRRIRHLLLPRPASPTRCSR